LCPGRKDGGTQTGIPRRVAAAHLGCNGDFLRELREKLPSLLVEGTFNVFNFGPLTMTRHGSGMLIE
jgi:hypothetical protein